MCAFPECHLTEELFLWKAGVFSTTNSFGMLRCPLNQWFTPKKFVSVTHGSMKKSLGRGQNIDLLKIWAHSATSRKVCNIPICCIKEKKVLFWAICCYLGLAICGIDSFFFFNVVSPFFYIVLFRLYSIVFYCQVLRGCCTYVLGLCETHTKWWSYF